MSEVSQFKVTLKFCFKQQRKQGFVGKSLWKRVGLEFYTFDWRFSK